MDTREFDLYSILAVTHRLPSNALPFRTILAHITRRELAAMPGAGVSALTVGAECRAWLLEQHPRLRDIPLPPDFHDDEAAMDAWADEQAARLGVDRLPVAPLPEGTPLRTSLGDLLDVIARARGGLDDVAVADPAAPDFGLGNPDHDHPQEDR
ncbi:hypothetical protein [Amycolatopsis benzoatilytica]|uniref:hypothetical protein n=1 Tax=Amycolatopsis benzoatilytica TaxID=346045 RepID=UPI000366674B|nr:hypothetical protein [Amycolatopsis benzoatilytica]